MKNVNADIKSYNHWRGDEKLGGTGGLDKEGTPVWANYIDAADEGTWQRIEKAWML